MKLHDIAHGRTGDKGDTSNISVIAYDPAHWPLIRDWMTADRVAAHFETFDERNIERFELPQLQALNFVIRGALSGGVTRSLAQDAHGKCLASALLEMQVDYED
ncbi:hypothetical protein GI582_24530 [Sulfitobacter sp. BDSS02]|nr:hypothetical protein [Sulfitobacter sp. BDSS02]MBR9852471.1 hypothetical protein [Paracoccaceae bacterium]